MNQPNHASSHSAFTLIEMLVVIAIMGILAALLFPAFSKARAQASLADCNTKGRAGAQAAIDYATNNRGVLPATTNSWITDVRDALGEPGPTSLPVQALSCPTMQRKYAVQNGTAAHYAFNDNLTYTGNNGSPPLPRAARAKQRSASLFEIDNGSGTAMVIGDVRLTALASEGDFGGSGNAIFPHGGEQERGTIAFVDGHVESLFYDQVPTTGNEGDAFWKAEDPANY